MFDIDKDLNSTKDEFITDIKNELYILNHSKKVDSLKKKIKNKKKKKKKKQQ